MDFTFPMVTWSLCATTSGRFGVVFVFFVLVARQGIVGATRAAFARVRS